MRQWGGERKRQGTATKAANKKQITALSVQLNGTLGKQCCQPGCRKKQKVCTHIKLSSACCMAAPAIDPVKEPSLRGLLPALPCPTAFPLAPFPPIYPTVAECQCACIWKVTEIILACFVWFYFCCGNTKNPSFLATSAPAPSCCFRPQRPIQFWWAAAGCGRAKVWRRNWLLCSEEAGDWDLKMGRWSYSSGCLFNK